MSAAGDFFGWLVGFLQTYNAAVTAVATFAIGVFTALLVWVTNRQARLTRDSIELANKEFLATHRPRIIVRFIQGPFQDEDGLDFVWITLVNKGETDGTIVAVGRDLARRKGRGCWLPPGVSIEPRSFTPTTLASGDRLVIKATAHSPMGEEQIFDEAFQPSELCAVGCIQYRDGNERLLETGFLRTYDGQRNFLPSDNPEDEYQD